MHIAIGNTKMITHIDDRVERASLTAPIHHDSVLAREQKERILNKIQNDIRDTLSSYVGKFNTEQTQQEMKAQVQDLLNRLACEEMALVDENGRRVTIGHFKFRGDMIGVPHLARTVPECMMENDRYVFHR